MKLKVFAAVIAGMLILAGIDVNGFEHWAQEFAKAYIAYEDVSVLDALISEAEFYSVLGECVGADIDKPDAPDIRREVACAAIAQYLPERTAALPDFTDNAEITPELIAGLERLYYYGLIDGYPDGSFKPRQPLTIGEACKLFSGLRGLLSAPEPIEQPARSTRTRRSSTGGASGQPGAVAETPVQGLSFTAEMGDTFRSINVEVNSVGGIGNPRVYYMVLESGSARPTAQEVVAGGRGVCGGWADADRGVTAITAAGLIDGYNYDVYMVAAGGGEVSEVAAVSSVMAMPFAAKADDGKTFTLKSLGIDEINKFYPDLSAYSESSVFYQTARQLDNIRRLAQLYEETGGVHGSTEFMSAGYTYVLAEDMDLSHYMSQDGERGWRPIGTFTGCLDGNGNTIYGLYIDRDTAGYEGLFGKLRSACVRNLNVAEPVIITSAAGDGDSYTCVGAIAGESLQSVIENVSVISPGITAAAADGMFAAGGVCGSCVNTDLSRVTVTGADISVTGGQRDVVGGITGRYYINREGKYLFGNLFASGIVSSEGKAGGGIAGTLDSMTDASVKVFAENIDSLVRVVGRAAYAGGVVGNVGYEGLLGANTRITFDNCYASGMIKGADAAGGLFGKANAAVKDGFVVKDSASEADIIPISEGAVLGGFIAETHSGSFEGCHSVGSGLSSLGSNAGGFVGIARGRAEFISCLANRNVQADENAGGFIGSQDGGAIRFYDCTTGGRVSGAVAVGDFAGALTTDKTAVEIVSCTVMVSEAVGRLVGAWK